MQGIEDFIELENIRRFRELLTLKTDAVKLAMLRKLLAESEARYAAIRPNKKHLK